MSQDGAKSVINQKGAKDRHALVKYCHSFGVQYEREVGLKASEENNKAKIKISTILWSVNSVSIFKRAPLCLPSKENFFCPLSKNFY